uniref:Uncharacterized protein n=1 Tax=Monodon monoceros TaxID=40151 RepID=A0A8C6BUW1_MONMO
MTSSYVLVSIFFPLSCTHRAAPETNHRLPQLLILMREKELISLAVLVTFANGCCSFPCIPFHCRKLVVIIEKKNKTNPVPWEAEHPDKPPKLMRIDHQWHCRAAEGPKGQSRETPSLLSLQRANTP